MVLTDSLKEQLCLECLFCCGKIGIPTRFLVRPDIIEWLQVRGFKVKDTDGFLDIWHDSFPCPSLTEKGCSIYPNRPDACRYYDGRKTFGKKCAWSKLEEIESRTTWFHSFVK